MAGNEITFVLAGIVGLLLVCTVVLFILVFKAKNSQTSGDAGSKVPKAMRGSANDLIDRLDDQMRFMNKTIRSQQEHAEELREGCEMQLSQLEAARKKARDSEARVTKALGEIETWNKEILTLIENQEKLSGYGQTLETLTKGVATLEQNFNEVQKTNGDLANQTKLMYEETVGNYTKDQVATFGHEIDAAVSTAVKKILEQADTFSLMSDTKMLRRDMETQFNKIKKEIVDGLEHLKGEVESSVKDVRHIREWRDLENVRQKSSQDKFERLEKESNDLEIAISQMKAQEESLKASIAELEESKAQWQKEIAALESESNTAKIKVQAANKDISELNKQVAVTKKPKKPTVTTQTATTTVTKKSKAK